MRYILFDFDGVITKQTFDGASQKTFIDVMTIRKKYKIPFKKAMVRVLGNDSQAITNMIDTWFTNNVLNKRIIPIIRQMDKEGQLGIATNNCPDIVDTFLDHYNLTDTFEKITRFYPETIGLVWKPDKRYFMAICKELNCDISELTLIDDDYENIKGIKSIGGHGLWYDSKNGRIR